MADTLARELADLGVGDRESRAAFVRRIADAWRGLFFGRREEARQDRAVPELHRLAVEIRRRYGELEGMVSEYARWLEYQYPEEVRGGDMFVEVVEPTIESCREEAEHLSESEQHWRFLAFLTGSKSNPRRVLKPGTGGGALNPNRPQTGGRPRRGGPELVFAVDLAKAWQNVFGTPAGLSDEATFLRFYRQCCEELGLKPISRSVLVRVFKMGRSLGRQLGAERPGRPKKGT
ncbi:hypothetical protein [Minwuia thermotolerans]|uniref:Uncharacterized protein n=1 Tax=Minwuia thermotolerans TaxID=2056226 RepID=A0A2M9G424_9PROT|nr:hypothetical protein [Minwuia thermotolerans]PJK30434.1 hypothetical protein CVT23_06720 [Minwuia thermotolerans]